ncbi:active regulator of SIRT1-like [Ceratina calcarata]|uniref:Active regulator of SIRT1 n=1 Tax=Ceratina calcarata TaxID=156304 RepID=A0AAJ7IQW1_9HYME|nr:active regulator of SIRT1-like [Ceratina calcarata]
MSNSLVRKSLELLGYEKRVKEGKKNRKQIKYKGTLDLIPPKHRIISKNDKTDLLTILGRSGRTTVYEAQKRLSLCENRTDENARKLLMLSKKCIEPKTANKLLERAVRKKHIPKPKKKKEEATAFTEEDFKKFEAEYVDQ